MKRFVKPAFLVVLGVVLYLIATSSGAGWLYVVAAAIGATVLTSALAPFWNVRNVEVNRRVPAVGTAGMPLSCSAEIRNTGRLSRHMLEVKDRFAGGTGGGVVPRLKGEDCESLDYTVENPQRGIYGGGEVAVESGAPFGLFFGRRRRRVTSNIIVYPRTFDVADLPRSGSAPANTDRDEAQVLHRGAGESSGEFESIVRGTRRGS